MLFTFLKHTGKLNPLLPMTYLKTINTQGITALIRPINLTFLQRPFNLSLKLTMFLHKLTIKLVRKYTK